MKYNYKKYAIPYLIIINILALISVMLVILNMLSLIDLFTEPFFFIDSAITLIFTIDYIIRFKNSNNKARFIKRNIFDLVAIMPFTYFIIAFNLRDFSLAVSLFRFANLAKVGRLIKIGGITRRIAKKFMIFLRTNGFIYYIYTTVGLLFVCSVLISLIEGRSFGESMWFSIVTCATVGYGDVSPSTGAGRCIAVILILFGVSLLSMLTSTMTTYFSNRIIKRQSGPDNEKLLKLIDSAGELSGEQIETLVAISKLIRNENLNIEIKN